MLPLHTARLTLRRLQDSDLQELVAYRSLPQVMEWQLWDSYDLAKGRELIAECQDLKSRLNQASLQLEWDALDQRALT